MDTTEQYIKMCEKAFPYLKEHVPLFSRRKRMYYVVDGNMGLWWDVVNTSNCEGAFPLWEQDQLQEMFEHSPYDCFFDGVPNDNEDEKQKTEHYYLQFKSWEQLLLAFVMSEKFGKTWDSTTEEWLHLDK